MEKFNRVSVACKLIEHKKKVVGISFTPQYGIQAVYFCNELIKLVNHQATKSSLRFEFTNEQFLFYVKFGWGVTLRMNTTQGNQLLEILDQKKFQVVRSGNEMLAESRIVRKGVPSSEIKLVPVGIL